MVLHYCDKCGARVNQHDIDTGRAKVLDQAQAICPSCSGPEIRQASNLNGERGSRKSDSVVRIAPSTRRDSERRTAPAGSSPADLSQFTSAHSSTRTLLIVGGAVGVVVLVAISFLMLGIGDQPRAREEAAPPRRHPEATGATQSATPEMGVAIGSASVPTAVKTGEAAPPDKKADYDPRASVADSLLAGAKDYLKKNPEDLWGYKDRLDALCEGYAQTSAAKEATRLLAEWKEPPADQQLSGLAAYWPFDEGSGATARDASGQGHDGTLVDAPQWVSGQRGRALRFSGKQRVLIAKSEDLELGRSDFTVAAWIKTTRGGALFCKTAPDGKWVPNGKSLFVRNSAPAFDIGWIGAVSGSAVVADGQWHHVAVSFQASSKKVFLFADGRSAGAKQLQSVGDPAGTVISLGFGFPDNYVGELDEVCVFRRCLLPSQARMLLEKGVGEAPQSAPVATTNPAPPAAKSEPQKNEPQAAAKPGEVPATVPSAPPAVSGISTASIEPKAAPRCAVYEPFDYPMAKPIEGLGGTSDMGFEGPWKRGTEIVSKAMAWGGLPTAGNCIAATRNYEAYRVIGNGALRAAGLLDDGATLWLSFLMSVEQANLTNVDMNIALASQPFTFYTTAKYHQRMELEKGGSGIGVAYCSQSVHGCVWVDGKRQSAKESTRKFDAGPNALALIVAKITWGRDAEADTIEVYAPDRNLDPGPVVSKTSANLDQESFTILGIQMKEEHTHVDEIRMGATYADVTSDTIAKLLHGLKIEEAVGTVERDGYRLSLGILKNLSERFNAAKVEAKKLATVGDAIASSSTFDASVRKILSAADGYAFAGPMGFASSSTTVSAALKNVPRQLNQEKPEVVRVCIGLSDMARNLAPGDFQKDLRSLVDAILDAGAIPVLHTLPVKTVAIPEDKTRREAADRATKTLYAMSEIVGAFNAAIVAVASEKKLPLLDAWHIVNARPEAQQKYFEVRGGLGREGYEAINERFLRLYRVIERGIAGRSPEK